MTLLGPIDESATTMLAQRVADWDRTQPWQKSLDAIINGVVPEIHPCEDPDILPVMGYITKQGNIAIDEPRWDMATVAERKAFLLELVKDVRLGESQLVEHPGHASQKAHGRRGAGAVAGDEGEEFENVLGVTIRRRTMGTVSLKEGQTFETQQEADDAIRSNAYESVIITRPGGKPTVFRTGDESSVSLSESDKPMLDGAVVTHNHPAAAANPGLDKTHYDSFSPEDVSSSVQANVAEARVVTPFRTFSLKRPEDGWAHSGNLDPLTQAELQSVATRYVFAQAGAAYSDAHPLDVGHVTNIDFARYGGYDYTVTNGDGTVQGPKWPEMP